MTTTEYVKHVSFDDLAPTLVDDQVELLKHSKKHVGFNNQFLHVPPQFNPLYQANSEEKPKESRRHLFTQDRSNIRYKSQDEEKFEKMLQFMAPYESLRPSSSGNDVLYRNRSDSPSGLPRSSPRLPPPPKISSLKDSIKSVDEPGEIADYDVSDMDFQTEKKLTKETEKNTQSNSGSRDGYTQAAFANLNELEDRLDSSSTLSLPNKRKKEEKNDRRKSFAGMTDQELADLENYYTSQSRSTTHTTIDKYDFKQQDPIFMDDRTNKGPSQVVDPLAAIYPSRPVIDHRAISVTVQNVKYEQFVQDTNTKTGSKKPEESLAAIRNVICYISGRRYTWSSVDWYVENCAQDGDHLAIVTSIPFFEQEVNASTYALSRKHLVESHNSEYGSFDDHDKDFGRVSTSSSDKENTFGLLSKGQRIKAIHEEAKKKCVEILKYYALRLQGKIVKVTVEMIKTDSAEYALTKAAALYKPDFQILSTVSTNLQIKFRNGNVKLPFFVMRHYPMPTVVVPYEFIDPRLLGEDVPKSESSNKPISKIPSGDDRLLLIDNVILKTLKNPFAPESSSANETKEDNQSVVDSINEYFPMSPEQKRKYESFEKMGYIRCTPTRQNFYMKGNDTGYDSDGKKLTPFSTASNSRRNSRLQYDDGIYKVKSLIDDSTDDQEEYKHHQQGNSIRKIKSMGPITKSTSMSPTLSPTTSLGRHRRFDVHTTGTKSPGSVSAISEGRNKKEKKPKEKKSLGSFFRKVFK